MKTLIRFCALCLVGCDSFVYRAETKLFADGKVDRAIVQPRAESPARIRDPKLWQTFALTAEAYDPALARNADLQIEPENKAKYIFAKQSFRTIESMPDHVLITSPTNPNCPPVKLVRAYTKRQIAFVIEHDWRETLTESFDILKARKGRDKLADQFIEIFSQVFLELHGSAYDPSRLVDWLRGEGKSWWIELTDAIDVEGAAGRLRGNDKALEGIVARVCKTHGLDLGSENALLQDPELTARVHAFVIALFVKHIRGNDGQPIPLEQARKLWMELHADLESASTAEGGRKLDSIIKGKHGGKESFERKISLLCEESFGLSFFDTGRHQFDYCMTMLGSIVETTGVITAQGSVRWRFTLFDSYPLGYTMRCRSLAPDLALQMQVLGKTPLLTRDQLVEFLSLMEDPTVQAEVQAIVDKKSLASLQTRMSQWNHNADAAQSAQDRDRKNREFARLDRLLRLLGG